MTLTLSDATAPLVLGNQVETKTTPLRNSSLSLLRIGAGAPSAEQIETIYNEEKMLFEADSKCTLAGTSDAVLAVKRDQVTDVKHVMTSYGCSSFNGLLQVESEASVIGTPTSVSAHGGDILQGGNTAVKYYSPAETLRAELKKQEVTNPLALEPFWFTGDAVETEFDLPMGWEPKFVYNSGLLVKEGATGEYTVKYDGFIYTVSFIAAPAAGNVCVMGVR